MFNKIKRKDLKMYNRYINYTMKNIRLIHGLSFTVLTIIIILSSGIVFLSDVFRNTKSDNSVINFMIEYHIAIMFLTIIISIIYGFFWSLYLAGQLEKKEKDSKKVFDIVIKFLSIEERLILKHVSENGFKTTQAEISRLQNMGRVKALRTVKKMSDKGIITISPHGKQRIIKINENLQPVLDNSKDK